MLLLLWLSISSYFLSLTSSEGTPKNPFTPNLPTNIVDFGGFASSIILIQRGGILRPIGDFPESLTRAMLVGTILLGGLGEVYVSLSLGSRSEAPEGPRVHPWDCS